MKLLLLALLTAVPYSITCPFDGANVGWTGHYRVREGATECQYVHAHIYFHNGFLLDQKHELWQACEVSNEKEK